LLDRRQGQGRIRDGHGDLRLEHVYFPAALPGEPAPPPLVIDCLEFSQQLRRGDVALDVAFLAMELLAADHPLLAEHFIYRFARNSNDYELYPVLDFFIAYRALVRAKVACLLARDSGTIAAKARRKRAEANRLLDLAYAREQAGGSRPLVVAMTGLPGTGKSTLAEALALRRGLPVVSSDATRKFLAGVSVRAPAPVSAYTSAFSERTYQEVLARGRAVLRSGRSVALDATFRTPEHRALARRLAADHGARFLLVETYCDEAILHQRLQARAREGAESDAGQAVLPQLRAAFVPPSELPAAECLRVDTSRPSDDLVAEILAHAGR
jgi:predicted kinase